MPLRRSKSLNDIDKIPPSFGERIKLDISKSPLHQRRRLRWNRRLMTNKKGKIQAQISNLQPATVPLASAGRRRNSVA